MLSERATLPANKPKFYDISIIEFPVYAVPKTYILGKYLDSGVQPCRKKPFSR